MITCIGGPLDGERVDDTGPVYRWAEPMSIEKIRYSAEVPAMMEERMHTHTYLAQRISSEHYNVMVYVWEREPKDWLIKLVQYYALNRDRMAPPEYSRQKEESYRHAADALAYLHQRVYETIGPKPVDKPVVDKKPTPAVPKMPKVEFSTASKASEPKKLK